MSNHNSLIYLDAVVRGERMKVMIDTGANRTFISNKALKLFQDRTDINYHQRRVFLADGRTSILVYGEVNLSIVVSNVYTSIRALIVKDLCAHCILGLDFITKYRLIINMVNKTVSLGVKNHRLIIPMADGEEAVRVPVRLINNIRILPQQHVSVPVSVLSPSINMVVKPSFKLQQKSPVEIDSSLSARKGHMSSIALYNPMKYPCSLPKGIILGTTTTISPILARISLGEGEPPASAFVPVDQSIIGTVFTRSRKKQLAQDETEVAPAPSTVEKRSELSSSNHIKSVASQPSTNLSVDKQFDLEQIRLEQLKDLNIQQKIKEIQRNPTQGSFILYDGLLYKLMPMKSRSTTKVKLIYLPSSMIDSLLKVYRSDPLSGHFGIQRTYLKLKNRFWWPGMKSSIGKYVKSCLPCQQYNVIRIQTPDQWCPIETPEGSFQLQFGQEARLSTDGAPHYVFHKPMDYYQQLQKNLKIIHQQARSRSTYIQQPYKKHYNKNRLDPRYEINDQVLVRIQGPRSKLDPRYSIKPRIIIREQHPTYWVRDEETESVDRVHVNDIRQILIR